MNIVNRFFLKLLLLPSGFYRKMGVNTDHLETILRFKLIMDDRRPNSIHQTRQKKQVKPISFATLGLMLFSVILGSIFLVSFAVGNDDITKLTIYFSFYIFVLASTLISDFTSVLIDVRDNMIILPKPINDKTFVLARLLHIIIHVSKIVIPMSLPGMILVGVVHGAGGLFPFIFLILSATLFTIFLINAMYILILRLTTPQKFKSIISYFQIAFAIVFYGGYQLVPRLINKAALAGYSVSTSTWAIFAPSYWLAVSWQFMKSLDFTAFGFVCFLVSILLPVFSIWIVISYFAPSFNQKLSMISGSEGESTPVKTGKNKFLSTTSSYISHFSNWITKKGVERMSFLFTWKMTSRSRDYKMKVYPTFGYLLVYIVLMFINISNGKKISFHDIQEQTGSGKIVFIGVIYISSFMLLMALSQLIFSEKYKAAWIYYVTPVKEPGAVISGAVKSVLVKYFIPIVGFTSMIALGIVGIKIIPNLVLGICNQCLVVCCVGYISIKDLPFSILQSMNSKSGSFIRGLFSLIIPGALALVQYFLYSFTLVISILAILSGIACWLVLDAIKQKTWENIIQRNYE